MKAHFPERLKELREEKGMTQQELANILEMNHANISRWERGLQDPTLTNLLKIAEVFNISLDNLAGVDFPENY